jgi:hypothetical protein
MTQLAHIDSRSASLAPAAPLTTLPTQFAEHA